MITADQKLIAMGLRKWDESGLLLITPQLFEALPDGFELVSIFGDTVVKGEDKIDTDTRMGLMAYGVLTDRQKGDMVLFMKI